MGTRTGRASEAWLTLPQGWEAGCSVPSKQVRDRRHDSVYAASALGLVSAAAVLTLDSPQCLFPVSLVSHLGGGQAGSGRGSHCIIRERWAEVLVGPFRCSHHDQGRQGPRGGPTGGPRNSVQGPRPVPLSQVMPWDVSLAGVAPSLESQYQWPPVLPDLDPGQRRPGRGCCRARHPPRCTPGWVCAPSLGWVPTPSFCGSSYHN